MEQVRKSNKAHPELSALILYHAGVLERLWSRVTTRRRWYVVDEPRYRTPIKRGNL